MADWYVGQKVVCINDRWRGRSLKETLRARVFGPKRGRNYVIAGVRAGFCYPIGLIFDPFPGTVPGTNYCSDHFRPVVEPEADISISIFTDILDQVNRREVVDA